MVVSLLSRGSVGCFLIFFALRLQRILPCLLSPISAERHAVDCVDYASRESSRYYVIQCKPYTDAMQLLVVVDGVHSRRDEGCLAAGLSRQQVALTTHFIYKVGVRVLLPDAKLVLNFFVVAADLNEPRAKAVVYRLTFPPHTRRFAGALPVSEFTNLFKTLEGELVQRLYEFPKSSRVTFITASTAARRT